MPIRKLSTSRMSLSLVNDKHAPYKKPNNTPLYVHVESNHLPGIIKNIPESINKRLSHLSCDKAFNSIAPMYQAALERSGQTPTEILEGTPGRIGRLMCV